MGEAAAATRDLLLGGRVTLAQPAQGYRAAIDPVLLAAGVPARDGDRVLDLGCGVGAAALCLLARRPDCWVTGLELQGDLADLARRNAAAERFIVVEGDVAAPPEGVEAGTFDQVMANPPYLPAGRDTASPHGGKATANQEGTADLEVWIAAAHRALRPKGSLTMIHRADRFAEVCGLLTPRFGGVVLIPLWPKDGAPAKRVVIRARKGDRSPATVAPGLVLHGADGGYTPQADAVLRDAAALP
ncbi:MAG: tRNA1(Val) (adenine(37)-N6)-methyltransferase [Inquilinaceae bacterium]